MREKQKSFGKKNQNDQSNLLSSTAKVAAGLITGAIAGMLLAPKSGKETRKTIKDKSSELGGQISDKSAKIGETTKDQWDKVKDKVSS